MNKTNADSTYLVHVSLDFPRMGPDTLPQILVVIIDDLLVPCHTIDSLQVWIATILHEHIQGIKVLKEAGEVGGSQAISLGTVCNLLRCHVLGVFEDEVHQMDIIIRRSEMHGIGTIILSLHQISPIVQEQLEHLQISTVRVGPDRHEQWCPPLLLLRVVSLCIYYIFEVGKLG